jgi:hypothetical protein
MTNYLEIARKARIDSRTREHLAHIALAARTAGSTWNLWESRREATARDVGRFLAELRYHVEAAALVGQGFEPWCDGCDPQGWRRKSAKVEHLPCPEHDAEGIRNEAEDIARVLELSPKGRRRLEDLVAWVHGFTLDPETRNDPAWVVAVAGAYLGLAAKWAALLGRHTAISCPVCIPSWAETRFASWPCVEHGGRELEHAVYSALKKAIRRTDFQLAGGESSTSEGALP